MLHSRVHPVSGCWIWTGNFNHHNGYAQRWEPMVNGKRRKEYVHRQSYREFNGPIPDGTEIDHVASRGCISKLCWNPGHLEAVTHQVNTQRRGHPCGIRCIIHDPRKRGMA